MKRYLVGGAVRDGLLGLKVKDHDWVVVHSSPEQMLADGFIAVGKDFPVFLHPQTHEEYALARTERKSGSGYHGFDCFFNKEVTIEEDLLRRDLTINAIAFDFDLFQKEHPDNQRPSSALNKLKSHLRDPSLYPSIYLVDPYDGLSDLLNKSLRHVSIAFKEDPLRVLRLARFYAQFYSLGFQIHPSTSELIDEMISQQELTTLTKERVWQETVKALSTGAPNIYFEFLAHHQALKQIFPTLFKCITPIALRRLAHIAQKTQCAKVRFSLLLANINDHTELPLLKDKRVFNRFFDELRISNEFKSLVWISIHHTCWENILIDTSEDLLSLLLSLNVLRQPENLEYFIQICTAITEIEASFHNSEVTQKKNSFKANLLKDALQALIHLDIEEIIAQGLPGPDIKLAIKNAQLEAIQKVKVDYSND